MKWKKRKIEFSVNKYLTEKKKQHEHKLTKMVQLVRTFKNNFANRLEKQNIFVRHNIRVEYRIGWNKVTQIHDFSIHLACFFILYFFSLSSSSVSTILYIHNMANK